MIIAVTSRGTERRLRQVVRAEREEVRLDRDLAAVTAARGNSISGPIL
jgi:hypothetical protein